MTAKHGFKNFHVCLICASFPPVRCGVGDYTARLAQALADAGARVSVVTSDPKEAPRVFSGVAVYPVVRSWAGRKTPALGRILQSLKPDCAAVMYPSLGYGRGLAPNFILGWLGKKFPACGRLLILHEYAMFSWLGRARLRPALAAAQAVVCTNHRDRRALRRHRLPKGRVRVIPLGSAVAPAADPSAPATFTSRSRCVHFGAVMPNKGWETLLAAWQQLQGTGSKLQLEAIGALEPVRYAYHARVARDIARRCLFPGIRFTGYLPEEEVRKKFKNSSGVAVMPFRRGAQLNRSSLVAVLSAGLAVVTTRPPQALEGLRHGEHYWLVAPDDPQGLAEGIRQVSAEPKLRSRLQAGARQAAKRFAWARIARQMLSLARAVAP